MLLSEHSGNISTALESILVESIFTSALRSLDMAFREENAFVHQLAGQIADSFDNSRADSAGRVRVCISSNVCAMASEAHQNFLMLCCTLQGYQLCRELAAFCSIQEHFLSIDLAPAAMELQSIEEARCPLEVAQSVEDVIHLLVKAANTFNGCISCSSEQIHAGELRVPLHVRFPNQYMYCTKGCPLHS